MTRNVTDAAVVLGAMTGIDSADPATAAQAGHAFTDYSKFLDKHALKGARIGVWRVGTYDPKVSPEVDAILNETIEELEDQGATVIDNTRIPIEPAYGPEFTALLCEFKSDIAGYLGTYTGASFPKTLKDLIDFNNAHPGLEGPWNSAIFDQALETGGRADAACKVARALATSTAQAAINDTLAANHLDAIIAPTNGPAWMTNSDPTKGDLDGDFTKFVGSSSPSAIAGYATITVPAGHVGPLPIGVSFIGGRWSEPELIGFAYDFKQATHVRVPPKFIPSIGPDPVRAPASPAERRAVVPGRMGSLRMPALR